MLHPAHPVDEGLTDARAATAARFAEVRGTSLALAEGLSDADQTVQSMPDASPTKWHLAHTTWFFETFVLAPHQPGYRAYDPRFAYLFNSYYEQAGPRHPRPQRGMLTRPSAAEVVAYRRHVDEAMAGLLETADAPAPACRPDRARPAPRAAASGAAADRHPASSGAEPAAPRLSPDADGNGKRRARRPLELARLRGRHLRDRPRGRGLRLRLRAAAARGAGAAVPSRDPGRDQRRVAGLHRRWRLSHGGPSGSPMAGPRSTARPGRRRSTGSSATAPGGR